MNSLDLMVLLARRKRMILFVTLAIAVLASVVSFMVTDTFTAATTILPPLKEDSVGSALLGRVQSISGLPAAAWDAADPADLSIRLLKSRSVQNAIVDRFDLRRVYSTTGYEDAREKLDRRTEFLVDKEGLITITVSDRDPNRATQIANSYVQQLLRALYQSLAQSEPQANGSPSTTTKWRPSIRKSQQPSFR